MTIRYKYIRENGNPQGVCIAYRFVEAPIGNFQVAFGVSTNHARWRVQDGQRRLEGDQFQKSVARKLAEDEIPEIPQIVFTGVPGKPEGTEFKLGHRTLTLPGHDPARFHRTAAELALEMVMLKLTYSFSAPQAMGRSGRPLMKKPRDTIRKHLTATSRFMYAVADPYRVPTTCRECKNYVEEVNAEPLCIARGEGRSTSGDEEPPLWCPVRVV